MSLRDDYLRDGVVFLPSVLTPDEVAALERGVARTMASPGPMALTMQPDDGSGSFFEDFCRWQDVDEFGSVIRGSAVGRIAGELMGSDSVRLFHDHTLVKEAGSSLRTPWHQDQPYYCIDGAQTVSLWIPLDPVSRRATLEFVAGSHGGTWYMPRSFQRNTAMVFDEGTLEDVPDIEGDRDAFSILGWEMAPGDAVAFNMLTLHASGGAEGRRRAFSIRMVGDDVTYARRPHRTSPTFAGIDDELADGAPLRSERLFPVLWGSD
jgi:ectoine hydroxylase-related dioxygenase (phytanoyl-CoA dioxygenase family)